MTGEREIEPPSVEPEGDGPLSESEFHQIYAKVPRLTVAVVIQTAKGILLVGRTSGPCMGLWGIPGGTVRFGEFLRTAPTRVATTGLGLDLQAGTTLDYIEYPSHYLGGLDSPVELAYLGPVEEYHLATAAGEREWFTTPAEPMHTEQRDLLFEHRLMRNGDRRAIDSSRT